MNFFNYFAPPQYAPFPPNSLLQGYCFVTSFSFFTSPQINHRHIHSQSFYIPAPSSGQTVFQSFPTAPISTQPKQSGENSFSSQANKNNTTVVQGKKFLILFLRRIVIDLSDRKHPKIFTNQPLYPKPQTFSKNGIKNCLEPELPIPSEEGISQKNINLSSVMESSKEKCSASGMKFCSSSKEKSPVYFKRGEKYKICFLSY